MATNDILPFGATASNELSQAAYSADAQRLTGNQPGVARSALNNKVLHQASLIASGVAQFIADRQAANVVDTLTPAQIASMLADANTGRLIAVRVFTTSTTYTPTAGTKAIRVRLIGGGGAGGGAPATAAGQVAGGTGGVAGAYTEGFITTGFSGASIVVGPGGTTNVGFDGVTGGASSFAGLLAGGGNGGSAVGPQAAPLTSGGLASAVSSGGYVNIPGQRGGVVMFLSSAVGLSGPGANGPLGVGGGAINSSAAGVAGTGFGGGGGGALNYASQGARGGGAGANGVCIIEELA